MASGGIHTVFKNGKWVNETEGAARAISRHDSKAEAQARGREVAKKRKVEHHIHKEDGKIGQRHSYGNDPSAAQQGLKRVRRGRGGGRISLRDPKALRRQAAGATV